ncbi:MAG: Hsp70 family protein, partial [Patescibacteria group bacterium]
KMIEKNTTVPVARTQIFSTAADNQPSVEVHVLQGEREMARDNKTLGRFILDGIPPSPRGVPQVEVTFDIDANGILQVKAKDKATNKEQSIRIEASSGLSKEEIERMKKDAELHAAEDKAQREKIEVKNTAEALMYSTEKTLRDLGDKVKPDIKKELEEKVAALKQVKDGDDTAAIKKATDDLAQAAQKIGSEMYGGSPAGGPAGEGGGTKGDDDKPIEGEVEEKKE